jgi:hypothetical protein
MHSTITAAVAAEIVSDRHERSARIRLASRRPRGRLRKPAC